MSTQPKRLSAISSSTPLLMLLMVACCAPQCCARVFGRCELAQTLQNNYHFTIDELPDWLCLVRYESSYNTAAIHYNQHSTDNGLFQINSAYWCGDSGYNGCNIDCSLLLDDDISDDVACARLVFIDGSRGYSQWAGWRQHCKGRDLSGYIKGCNLQGGPPEAQGVRYSVYSWMEVDIRF